jgi:hypothetical protein
VIAGADGDVDIAGSLENETLRCKLSGENGEREVAGEFQIEWSIAGDDNRSAAGKRNAAAAGKPGVDRDAAVLESAAGGDIDRSDTGARHLADGCAVPLQIITNGRRLGRPRRLHRARDRALCSKVRNESIGDAGRHGLGAGIDVESRAAGVVQENAAIGGHLHAVAAGNAGIF